MWIHQESIKQYLTYYVYHLLNGAKPWSTRLEKLTLALTLMVRHLCPYFLSHSIMVMTNTPIGCILIHSEATGRLIKWATKLNSMTMSTISLDYESLSLANFLTKTTHLEEIKP